MHPFRRRYRSKERSLNDKDPEEAFARRKCATYLLHILNDFKLLDLDTLEITAWVLGSLMEAFLDLLVPKLDETLKEEFQERLKHANVDPDVDARLMSRLLERGNSSLHSELLFLVRENLSQLSRTLKRSSTCRSYRLLLNFSKIFELSPIETELCYFCMITYSYPKAKDYFYRRLSCDELCGMKYIATSLDTSPGILLQTLKGKLNQIGMIEIRGSRIAFEEEFLPIFHGVSGLKVNDRFFSPLKGSNLPMEFYTIPDEVKNYLIDLIRANRTSPTHILIYGPPGSGKSSFARSLIRSTGLAGYEIATDTADNHSARMTAVMAGLNAVNQMKRGGLVLVDEADALLNTESLWALKGTPEEKRWINMALEKPQSRAIWITNRVDGIDSSTKRRFAYSLEFKPLDSKQRIRLWEQVLRENRVKRHFSMQAIEELSYGYDVSVGVMDMCVRKAKESSAGNPPKLRDRLRLGLLAHLRLESGPTAGRKKENTFKEYLLDCLNLDIEPSGLAAQLESFKRVRIERRSTLTGCLSMLFYGPPGTGKTELGRYLAHNSGMKLICKRGSDIIDPYVGMTERKIAEAFREAEDESTVLLLDEVDTFLYPRSRAVRSWEVSFTNELLAQMESFSGVLICTTNRMTDLDEACLRRFTSKVEFRFLDSEGKFQLYQIYLKALSKFSMPDTLRHALDGIDFLTPGDFKVVRDRFRFTEPRQITHELSLEALRSEIRMKQRTSDLKTIGF